MAVAAGAEHVVGKGNWQLPIMGAGWHNRLDYTPSLEDFFGDYLLHLRDGTPDPETWEAISFRVSIVNLDDSTPAEGTDENSLAALIGLS